ncbi:acetyl-CoA acetyltransferase [Microbacterium sp. Root61]|uniref:acetyl-CoA acetyltransferase n=1 Tax=Microbacterium sp. Root61 TaxID=1736570 RepID=UPI000700DC67|nr:acetyl-CoA acetyltransferase [Microbacterium sp. Root61]KRA25403.1 acetyl-CoA acetyltransferase [Microbacterium sp. Root61]
MTRENIWILGGYQSDFARNYTREGLDFADLTREVVDGTLRDAGTAGNGIDVVHVGNAFGELFAHQGHLGAMPATVHDELWGTPSSRHEAACASGGIALLSAIADLRAGDYDSALVVGVELEKTVPGDVGAGHLGAAAWTGHEGQDAKFMWPYMFARVADEYDRRYGLDDRHLHMISQLNLDHAKRNPLAQTRGWDVPDLIATGSDDAVNPLVEGRLRRYDCSQMTDGGAGVVLVTDRYLRAHPDARPIGVIRGWGHRTVGIGIDAKLARDAENPYVMPHVKQALDDAFARAHVGLEDLHGLETHDCFSASEYLAIDHIGLTAPGQSWQAVEEGTIRLGGALPINPSGGLIGGGHPVGASGVRMLLDAALQVSDRAGEYQIEGAKTMATLNFGGSTATTVTFVVGEAASA